MVDEHSIPVDIFNPGHVFACLGFMEAADVLLNNAEGGFDWRDKADVRFILRTATEKNPFEEVLKFLADAQVIQLVPVGYPEPSADSLLSESFPTGEAKQKELPCLFENDGHAISLSHWADGSSRDNFKQFAGNQNPSGTIIPSLQAEINKLLSERSSNVLEAPFDEMMPVGRKSWKFDAHSAWTPRDVGYSFEDQKYDLMSSPVVELLAAVGLEHARPSADFSNKLKVRYGVWGEIAPLFLARPVIGGTNVGLPMRLFQFTRNALGKDNNYKQVTFAKEVYNIGKRS